MSRHLHPDFLQQLDEIVDIKYLRNILNSHGVCRQQRSANDFKCLVFGALWRDSAFQPMATFDDE